MSDTDFVAKQRKGFNPTLSFDGVAIILAAIGFILWMGAFSNRLSVAEKTLDHQAQIVQSLSDSQASLSKIVAVLQYQMDHPSKP